MKPIIYRGYEIRDCEARMYIPKYYPMLEIVNLSDCDANMLHADTIEEAKSMIDVADELLAELSEPKKELEKD